MSASRSVDTTVVGPARAPEGTISEVSGRATAVIPSYSGAAAAKSIVGVERCVIRVEGIDFKKGGARPTADAVRAAFIPFGNIADVIVPVYQSTGFSKGFLYVRYEEEEDAAAAVDNMDGAEVCGKIVWVRIARKARRKLSAMKAIWDDSGNDEKEERVEEYKKYE